MGVQGRAVRARLAGRAERSSADHGVVELLGADELDVGRDAVRRAEVERLLCLCASTTHAHRILSVAG